MEATRRPSNAQGNDDAAAHLQEREVGTLSNQEAPPQTQMTGQSGVL